MNPKSEPRQDRVNKFDRANHDSVDSHFLNEIYLSNGVVLTGYSGKMNITEPFGLERWKNFTNYVLRICFGKKFYYPGCIRGVDAIVFTDNKAKEFVCTIYKGYITWKPKYLLNKQWDDARKRLDKAIGEINSLPLEPTTDIVVRIQARYKYTTRKFKMNWDSNDLSPMFNNRAALEAYCRDLVHTHGYPEEQVKSYLFKYVEKYFSNDLTR